MLPSGQKLALALLATFTLEVVPFRAYAPFPVLLTYFQYVLEVLLCESVWHRLRLCLDHQNCVKMPNFQFYLQWGLKEK
jgi:hypothetical protein